MLQTLIHYINVKQCFTPPQPMFLKLGLRLRAILSFYTSVTPSNLYNLSNKERYMNEDIS